MDSRNDRVTEIWFPGNHCDIRDNYYTVPDNSCKKMQKWLEDGSLEPI